MKIIEESDARNKDGEKYPERHKEGAFMSKNYKKTYKKFSKNYSKNDRSFTLKCHICDKPGHRLVIVGTIKTRKDGKRLKEKTKV